MLRDLLPKGVTVVGIEETTALLIDVPQDTVTVVGRGGSARYFGNARNDAAKRFNAPDAYIVLRLHFNFISAATTCLEETLNESELTVNVMRDPGVAELMRNVAGGVTVQAP